MPLASAIISTGGSLVGGLLGSSGSTRAGNAINNAAIAAEHGVLNAAQSGQEQVVNQQNANETNVNAAGGAANTAVQNAAGNANTGLNNTLANVAGGYQPYLNLGTQGAKGLSDFASNIPQFRAPSAVDVEATPGFQFQLQEGTNAIQNKAAAAGLASSGDTLKALTQYGQGLASTYYQNAFNNAKDVFNMNTQNTLGTYGLLTNAGQNATNQFANAQLGVGSQVAQNTLGAGYYSGQNTTDLAKFLAQLGVGTSEFGANLGLEGSQLAGNYAVQGAQGRAAGILGSNNAWSNFANQTAGTLSNYATGGFGGSGSYIPAGNVGVGPMEGFG